MSPAVAVAVSAVGVLIALVSAGWQISRARGGDARELRDRVTVIETKLGFVLQAIQVTTTHILHSPHPEHARRDYLLEKARADQLAHAEAVELARALERMQAEQLDSGDQIAVGLLLAWLKAQFGLN